MIILLNKTIESMSNLEHFYDIQKKYIDKKSKEGIKKNSTGLLMDFYFGVLVNGDEKEQKQSTFLNLQKVMENHITIQEITDKSVLYHVKSDDPKYKINVSNAVKEYEKYAEMPFIHGNNTLIMLVTRFEEFIAEFIKKLYIKYPQKYLDNQMITFSEIEKYGAENIQNKIIEREVDNIMRESYSDWFKLFEEHKIKLQYCQEEYETLKELYARRNILVHNAGIVNDVYIKNVSNTLYTCGERLFADDEYLKKAFETMKTIVFCILIEAIKLDKETKEENIENIFNVAFEELMLGNFYTCETVFHALYKNSHTDEKTKHMSQVNYWIAKIENEGYDSVVQDVQKLDVTALDKIFLLAKYVLLRKYTETTKCIEDLYEKKELSICSLAEWPLFKDYRKTDEYKRFLSNHPEISNCVEIETKSENPMENKEVRNTIKTELQESNVFTN